MVVVVMVVVGMVEMAKRVEGGVREQMMNVMNARRRYENKICQ